MAEKHDFWWGLIIFCTPLYVCSIMDVFIDLLSAPNENASIDQIFCIRLNSSLREVLEDDLFIVTTMGEGR